MFDAETESKISNAAIAANLKWQRENPGRWAGVKSISDSPAARAAIAEAEKKAGRDLTYGEKRQLLDSLK